MSAPPVPTVPGQETNHSRLQLEWVLQKFRVKDKVLEKRMRSAWHAEIHSVSRTGGESTWAIDLLLEALQKVVNFRSQDWDSVEGGIPEVDLQLLGPSDANSWFLERIDSTYHHGAVSTLSIVVRSPIQVRTTESGELLESAWPPRWLIGTYMITFVHPNSQGTIAIPRVRQMFNVEPPPQGLPVGFKEGC